MDHTIQRQLVVQTAKVDALQTQVAHITTLIEQIVLAQTSTKNTSTPQQDSPQGAAKTTTTTKSTTNNVQVNNNTQINILAPCGLRSFDAEDRLIIPAALIKAAFTENPRLAAYCKLTDEEKTNAEAAAPYVLEALMELVKRAHKDPLSRNVYLNPKRADQVLVFVDSDEVKIWEVRPLLEAVRRIFDTVAGNIHRIIVTDAERAQLPYDIQSSASWIPNLYDDEPDKYVKEAKQPMVAHLTNTRPQQTLTEL